MDTKAYVCEFCSNSYKSLSSLNYHKKTAKFCIDLQNKPKTNLIRCVECDKTFATKQNLQHHQLICKEKKKKEDMTKEEEIDTYKTEIITLRQKVIDLEKELERYRQTLEKSVGPTINHITNNNTITNTNSIILGYDQIFANLKNFNAKNIAEALNLLSSDEYRKQIDFENFDSQTFALLTNIFNQFAFCTDKKRRTMVTKSDDDKAVRSTLSLVLSEFIDHGQQQITNYLEVAKQEIDEGVNNDVIDEITYYSFSPKHKELESLLSADNMNSAGDKDTFHHKMAMNVLQTNIKQNEKPAIINMV